MKNVNHSIDHSKLLVGTGALILIGAALFLAILFNPSAGALTFSRTATSSAAADGAVVPTTPPLDIAAYDAKLRQLAHASTTNATTSAQATTTRKALWPVKAPYPNAGALLPFNRIIAYYGNFYAKGMGVLGQYPTDVMLSKLKTVVAEWNAADPSTPAIPAIDYIAVTAQASAGADGMYRARMPGDQIQKAIDLANQVHGVVFLDVQVGKSTLQKELPLLKQYLKNPIVHLCIDPEFSMKGSAPPGREIGTFYSSDINYAAQMLAEIVRENNLPPKILVVHRFTQDMVTGTKQIAPVPEVQIVMDMDGWGSPAKKMGTYSRVIYSEPVQFTGFKLFYKNDFFAPSTGMMTPTQVIKLTPAPSFIQYQ